MSKKIFLGLTILAGIIIGCPHLNFYDVFSSGDHGRDLYVFEQAFKGLLVDKDIWWVYGPLMPYYYGLFFLLFGIKISSILIGKFVLSILCGVFFYLSATVVMPAFWAFLAACYFLQSQHDFFFTFNHIGGIAAELAVFWFILRFLYEKNLRFGFWALGACCILGLIKINFGISALVTTLISLALIDFTSNTKDKKIITTDNKFFYISGILIVPLIWLLIYGFFLQGLTIYEIRQCMPYFSDDQPYHRTIFETIPYYIKMHWLTLVHHWHKFQNTLAPLLTGSSALLNPMALLMFSIITLVFLTNPIIHGCTIAALIIAFSKKLNSQRRTFWLTQAVIWIFFILNFHEFLVSGVWYRTYWSQPFLLFFNFFMLSTAMSFSPKWLRYSISLIWLTLSILLASVAIISTKSSCTPDKFLTLPRGQIYVGNESAWVDTVITVTGVLNKTLKKDEMFFALPYDGLYYYLTGKTSPTRQLIFFDHIKILPAQEISIIKELESKKIAYVLMSNRVMSSEIGLGIFGKTYCPLINRYITENFVPIYRYGGNWQSEPGWGSNHGVMILKRKE